jgi:transcriptional regulator with XRE-family HTH domain
VASQRPFREVGKRLQQVREHKGFRQKDVAAELACTAKAVQWWEQGYGMPDVRTFVALCRLLDVDAQWVLFGGREPEPTYPHALLS